MGPTCHFREKTELWK